MIFIGTIFFFGYMHICNSANDLFRPILPLLSVFLGILREVSCIFMCLWNDALIYSADDLGGAGA